MDRSQLVTEIMTRCPLPGETVLVQRRGDHYDWSCLDAGRPVSAPGIDGDEPDAWVYYSGGWPRGDPDRLARHIDDLLAEMESMNGGVDRCRWPLDQPYPLPH
jgi:hypothetical protein